MHPSQAWTKQGLKVAVYGAFENQVYDGVAYHGADQFRGDVVYNTLILWRAVGALAAVAKDQLCARRLVRWLQTSFPPKNPKNKQIGGLDKSRALLSARHRCRVIGELRLCGWLNSVRFL